MVNKYVTTPWSSSAHREVLCVLWNSKVQYRAHKSPPAYPEPDESSPHHHVLFSGYVLISSSQVLSCLVLSSRF